MKTCMDNMIHDLSYTFEESQYITHMQKAIQ